MLAAKARREELLQKQKEIDARAQSSQGGSLQGGGIEPPRPQLGASMPQNSGAGFARSLADLGIEAGSSESDEGSYGTSKIQISYNLER